MQRQRKRDRDAKTAKEIQRMREGELTFASWRIEKKPMGDRIIERQKEKGREHSSTISSHKEINRIGVLEN